MSSKVPFPPPGFDDLSPDDQVEYVQDLSDYIDSRKDQIEIPDWHREILEERLARYKQTGMQGRPWEEFEEELIAQLTQN